MPCHFVPLEGAGILPYHVGMKGTAPTKSSRRGGGELTIADVARAAGVSPMTVSRVLNGGQNVRADTKEKVDAAIARLNYVPNAAARALAGGRNCRIALLYNNPSAAYLSALLMGALEACARLDAQLVVEPFVDDEALDALIARLALRRIDAVILPAPLCDNRPLRDELKQADLPIAQIASAAADKDCAAVSIDDGGAARTMMEYLLAKGHRRIGFITGAPNQSVSRQRLQGYCAALTEAGIDLDESLITAGDFTYRSGKAAGEALLSLPNPPTAIFAGNDDMAAAVVAVAQRRKLTVPDDIAVAGFDDTILATSIWPELTTIKQPDSDMAAVAVEALHRAVDRARTGLEPDVAQVQLPFTLIVRASV